LSLLLKHVDLLFFVADLLIFFIDFLLLDIDLVLQSVNLILLLSQSELHVLNFTFFVVIFLLDFLKLVSCDLKVSLSFQTHVSDLLIVKFMLLNDLIKFGLTV